MTFSPNAIDDPIFIVGVPRSGTTVFSVNLAKSAGIAMSPETHFMPEVYSPLKHLDLSNDDDVKKIITHYQSTAWFADLEIKPDTLLTCFTDQNEKTWPALFKTILGLYAKNHGGGALGEKTPGHYRHVKTLLAWYPNCQIIFMMRDPRAVVASNLSAPFSPSYSWFIAKRWREIWDIYKTVSTDKRVHMARYEDFVTNPNTVLKNLTKCLNIPSARKLKPSGNTSHSDQTTQKGWRAQHLQTASGSISAKSISSWKSKLSPYDIWVTHKIARSSALECGYELEASIKHSRRYQLLYAVRFPFQRTALAIRASTQMSPPRTVKDKALTALGKLIDWVTYMLTARDVKIGKDEKVRVPHKTAEIFLGASHQQTSSFTKLSSDSEVLGIFASSLGNVGYKVKFYVHTYEKYLTAKKITHAFGLTKQSFIIRTHRSHTAMQDKAELYAPNSPSPAYSIDKLKIDAKTAKQTALEITKLIQ